MFNFIRGRSRVHFQANSISVQPNANFNPQSILLTTIPPESSMEPPNPTDGSRPWISISPGWWGIHGRHFFLPSWVPCANNANAWVVGRKEVIILNRVFAILLLGLVGRFGSPLQLQIRFPTVSVKTHTTYN